MTWGAKVSDYKEEIERSNSEGYTPVFIELEIDLKFDFEIIIIDHHNEKSGTEKPSALRQIFSLLKLPEQSWDRWFSLVDANDKGYIDGMKSINASQEEIELVRRKDRKAQKITKQQEEEAITAIQNKKIFNDDLVIIDCPHSKNATITDRMSLEDSKYQNLLIISPEEINFYGQGKLIHALVAQFPNSWYGGNLPDSGYWGSNQEDFFDVTEFNEEESPTEPPSKEHKNSGGGGSNNTNKNKKKKKKKANKGKKITEEVLNEELDPIVVTEGKDVQVTQDVDKTKNSESETSAVNVAIATVVSKTAQVIWYLLKSILFPLVVAFLNWFI